MASKIDCGRTNLEVPFVKHFVWRNWEDLSRILPQYDPWCDQRCRKEDLRSR